MVEKWYIIDEEKKIDIIAFVLAYGSIFVFTTFMLLWYAGGNHF